MPPDRPDPPSIDVPSGHLPLRPERLVFSQDKIGARFEPIRFVVGAMRRSDIALANEGAQTERIDGCTSTRESPYNKDKQGIYPGLTSTLDTRSCSGYVSNLEHGSSKQSRSATSENIPIWPDDLIPHWHPRRALEDLTLPQLIRVFTLAVPLSCVESLPQLPALIGNDLIRLSVGTDEGRDLVCIRY